MCPAGCCDISAVNTEVEDDARAALLPGQGQGSVIVVQTGNNATAPPFAPYPTNQPYQQQPYPYPQQQQQQVYYQPQQPPPPPQYYGETYAPTAPPTNAYAYDPSVNNTITK